MYSPADFVFTIPAADVDILGHVNNAAYLQYYEEARWHAIGGRGYGVETVKRLQKSPVILEVNLKFLRELKLHDKVRITMKLVKQEGKVFHLAQSIIKEDGTVASEALFIGGLFDLKERRLVNPTPEWLQALGLKEETLL
jgi:acyl-CoA thioester hydrolase